MLKLKVVLMFFLVFSLTACSITLPNTRTTYRAVGWDYIEYDMSNAHEERMYLPYHVSRTGDGTCVVRFHVADLRVKDFEDKLIIEYRPIEQMDALQQGVNTFRTKDRDCKKAFVEYANKSKLALVKPLDGWKGLVISKKYDMAVLTQKEYTSGGLRRSNVHAVLNVFGYVYDPKEFEAVKIPCHTFFCDGKEEYYKTVYRLITKEATKQSLCDPTAAFYTALYLRKQGGDFWDRIFFVAKIYKEYEQEFLDCIHSDRDGKPRVLKGNALRIKTEEGCERFHQFLKDKYREFRLENNITGGVDGV